MDVIDKIGYYTMKYLSKYGFVAGATGLAGSVLGPEGFIVGGIISSTAVYLTTEVDYKSLLKSENPIIRLAREVYDHVFKNASFSISEWVRLAGVVLSMLTTLFKLSPIKQCA